MTAPCSCPAAGFCERHQLTKTEYHYKLCQEREDYRKVWDEYADKSLKRCSNWKQDGEKTWICTDCGKRASVPEAKHLPTNRLCVKPKPACEPPPPGVGTELAEIFKSIGIKAKTGCGCEQKTKVMDAWGIAGCRAKEDEIIAWLRKSYEESTAWEKAKAAAMSAVTGLAFKIDWTDPFPGLLAEAIRRAEEKYPPDDWQQWTERRAAVL